jgi:ketosteroid isomerase-like protein|tara:strand:+ start:52 stop:435 length:384 start_codon:yes stop_codon:yes gene_type:complete
VVPRAAAKIVRTYLRLVEERDLDAASEFLADDVSIVFPGGRTFGSLTDQVASSAGRFRSVKKTLDQLDVVSDGAETTVYVYGTLAGQALDGSSFDGVRFIDRFALNDGQIVSQMVWNDLAEVGALPA